MSSKDFKAPVLSPEKIPTDFKASSLTADDFVNEYSCYYISSNPSAEKCPTNPLNSWVILTAIMEVLESMESVVTQQTPGTLCISNNVNGERLSTYCKLYKNNPSLTSNPRDYFVEFDRTSGDQWVHIDLTQTFLTKVSEYFLLETAKGKPYSPCPVFEGPSLSLSTSSTLEEEDDDDIPMSDPTDDGPDFSMLDYALDQVRE